MRSDATQGDTGNHGTRRHHRQRTRHERAARRAAPVAAPRPRTDPGTGPSPRRALRREAVSTVGLLADDATSRPCGATAPSPSTTTRSTSSRSRPCSDPAPRAAHTTVALFDPEEYAEFCAEPDLDPDTPPAAAASPPSAAEPAPPSPTADSPSTTCVPHLIDRAVRRATWEYAHGAPGRRRRLRRLRPGHRPRRLRPGLPPADAAPRQPPAPAATTSSAASPRPASSSSPRSTPSARPPQLRHAMEPDTAEVSRVRHRPRGGHRPRHHRGTRHAHQDPGRTGPRPRLAARTAAD